MFFPILVFLWKNTAAQPVANAIFNQTAVETGDTFNLRVLVEGTTVAPEKVDFWAWQAVLPSKNILHQTDWALSGKHWAKNFTLISFDSAELKLPPLTVRLHLNDSVKTNPLELRVFPTPASSEISEMAGLREIRREPADWTDFWFLLPVALVLFFLGWKFLRKKPAPPHPIAAPQIIVQRDSFGENQIDLLETTLKKLDDLERRTFSDRPPSEAFSTELSMIVREFLEKKYGIHALESTTKEILQFLKTTNFPENQTAALRELLQKTDLSKFSKTPPPPGFSEKALQNARNIVRSK